MKYLLDTSILLWHVGKSKRFSEAARSILSDNTNEIYYSIVSIWEHAIKYIKKPEKTVNVSPQELSKLCLLSGLEELPLRAAHIYALETLSFPEDAKKQHNDPFDRILISQAKSEGMILLTHDVLLPYYNENCIVYV